MGFRQGAYARIWSYENKGNYSTCRLSISRKNKNTDAYETEFTDGFVRLVGNAHQAIQGIQIDEKKGYNVKISSCDVTNVYTAPDGKVSYTPHYTIFGFEDANTSGQNQGNKTGNNANSAPKSGSDDEFMNIPDGIDEELPFN